MKNYTTLGYILMTKHIDKMKQSSFVIGVLTVIIIVGLIKRWLF
jgi:hypothetical protein